MSLSIGHISYANCTPIFAALRSGFDCSAYDFIDGVPAHLNTMLRGGGVDVCPSSSIEYARSPHSYFCLPDLSISSVGAVKSVMLFSALPLDDLNGKEIVLTAESHTSVNLLRVLLGKFRGFRNCFIPAAQASSADPAAELLIGDAALRRVAAGRPEHVYDLGELWYRETGLPFVFALWLVRRDAVAERGGEVRRVASDLLAAKEASCRSYHQIAEQAVERLWMPMGALVDYWETISYDLTPAHLQGLNLFYRLCADLQVIPEAPAVVFLDSP